MKCVGKIAGKPDNVQGQAQYQRQWYPQKQLLNIQIKLQDNPDIIKRHTKRDCGTRWRSNKDCKSLVIVDQMSEAIKVHV